MSMSQVGYMPVPHQASYGAAEAQVLTIQEPINTYSFDGSCCCNTEIEDVVLRDDVVFVSKRFGCCCCKSYDDTVIKTRQIETTNVKTENSSLCALVTGWLLFGCLGSHRLCSGRKISGLIMGWLFILSIAMVTVSFIEADDTRCVYIDRQGWDCSFSQNSPGWLASGIFFSILLIFIVLWWFVDLFRLRHWT